MRHSLVPQLVVLGLLVARAAHGEPHDPAAAETLFREGRALATAGDYGAACAKFTESWRLDHAPGTLLNLADCQDRTGHTATAWAYFTDLVYQLPSSDERQPLAAERAASLERRLPHLTVRVTMRPGSKRKIFRDDVELGPESLGVPLPVDPGAHVVTLSDGDGVLRRTEVTVAEHQSRIVDADAGSTDRTGQLSTTVRTAGWISGGVAVAAVGAAIGFGVSALEKQGAANCVNGACPDPAASSQYDDAHVQARVADVALGIGVVAAAVAAGCLLFASTRMAAASHPRATAWTSLALGRLAW